MRYSYRIPLCCLLLFLLFAVTWTAWQTSKGNYSVYLGDLRAGWRHTGSPFERPTLLRYSKPTETFRGNLRNDTSYITSLFANVGCSNQFMNILNTIYLGILTNRVPIVPPFFPNHGISDSEPLIPFGDIFDLESLSTKLYTPILEWREVKHPRSVDTFYDKEARLSLEAIGCWTTNPEGPWGAMESDSLLHNLGLDVSYSRVPPITRYDRPGADGLHVVYSLLAGLIYPGDPVLYPSDLEVIQNGYWTNHSMLPDRHLACFDNLYYVTSGSKLFEWEESWSAVWHKVGRHLRYTPAMENLARTYLGNIFGSGKAIPPFIAVHIRRTDFEDGRCSQEKIAAGTCFPPLSAYAKHVEDIKREWVEKSGMTINHVLVTSDDLAPALLEDVKKENGWYGVDHVRLETVKHWGEFYPVFLDSAIQSMAVGFVGTRSSTFSLLSRRRIQAWNGGFAREVDIQTGR